VPGFAMKAQESSDLAGADLAQSRETRDDFAMLCHGLQACVWAVLAIDERLGELSIVIRRGQ
jgi:hypothetical protein